MSITIPGFVTVSDIQAFEGKLGRIPPITTGFFLQEDGKPETMVLYDEYAKVGHKMGNVTLSSRVNNAVEGDLKFPRPFLYKQDQGSGMSSLVQPGDKVLIFYPGGNYCNPVAGPSINSLATLMQVDFLKADPDNLDRQPTRYENKEFILEEEIDGHGDINLTLTGKAGQGTGNVNITVKGADDSSGQVNVKASGTLAVQQVDANGKALNQIKMSKDGLQVQGQNGSLEHGVYGETLKSKLEDLIGAIKAITVPTGTGPSGTPNNAVQFDQIKSKLEEILTE